MINFEEELAKFKPSPEIDDTEDLIMSENMTDMTDIMMQLIKDMKKGE